MKNIKMALLVNAVFSSICGVLLVFLHDFWAEVFELHDSTSFWIIGFGLLLFSGTVFYEVSKQRRWGILFIILQDLIWVVASAILLVLQPFGIGIYGNLIIAIIACLVLIFAIWQWTSLKKKN